MEKALSLSDQVELYQTDTLQENLSGYSLYVFDGVLPKTMPTDGHWLLINPPSGNGIVETGAEREFAADVRGLSDSGLETAVIFLLRWQKEHPFPLPGAQPFCRQKGRPWGFMEKQMAEK